MIWTLSLCNKEFSFVPKQPSVTFVNDKFQLELITVYKNYYIYPTGVCRLNVRCACAYVRNSTYSQLN